MLSYFERLTNPMPDQKETDLPKGLFAFFRYYCKGFEKALMLMAFLTLAVAVVEVFLFRFLGQLVDWLGSSNPETFLQDEFTTLVTMGILVLVVIPILVVLHSSTFHQALFINFSTAIRWRLHRNLLQQSYSFYQDEFAGRLSTKLMQTSEALRETVMKLLDILLYVVVYLAGMAALILSADWRLSLPLLVWLGLYGIYLTLQLPKLKDYASKLADAQSQMTGRFVDTYTNFLTVKLFSHSDRETDYIRESVSGYLGEAYPLMRRITLLNVGLWILNVLLIFSTTATAIYLWKQNYVTTGAIAIAVALTLRLKSLSQVIMWEIAAVFRNIGAVEDGRKTFAKTNSVIDQVGASDLVISQGKIDMNQIYFDYNGDIPTIRGLSLKIEAGEKVGIVGSSGAGKTTLINLLLRLYDLQDGQILIDGQDISTVTQDSLRGAIGVVGQETSMLHRSIRENILYGRPGATEEDMRRAAHLAHLDSFVEGLADASGKSGYDAEVGERGVKLSGGQRQRIAIARAFLKDAPILILDEATSALDSETESAIQENFQSLMEGKTVIAIAHRLSTIAAMDRLVVLDAGQVVETGSHQELLALKGRYYQLWQHQSGGFLVN